MLNFGVPNSHLPPHVRYDWMILGCLGFLKFMIKLDHFAVTLFCDRKVIPPSPKKSKRTATTKTFQNHPNMFKKKQLPIHVTLPPAQLPGIPHPKPSNQNNPFGAPGTPNLPTTRPSKRRPCRSSQVGELWSPIVPVKPRTIGRGVGFGFLLCGF